VIDNRFKLHILGVWQKCWWMHQAAGLWRDCTSQSRRRREVQ